MTTSRITGKNNSLSFERCLDQSYSLGHFLKTCLHTPVSFLQRLYKLPKYCSILIRQKHPDVSILNSKGQLTHTSIEREFYHTARLPQGIQVSKEQLHRVVDIVQETAQKMGITQGIKIYSDAQTTADASSGFNNGVDPVAILLSPETCSASDEMIAFIAAHELSHCIHNDASKEALRECATFALETCACVTLSPFVLPVIELLSNIYNKYARAREEEAADLSAMNALRSNKEAINFFKTRINNNHCLRASDQQQFQNNLTEYFNTSDSTLNVLRKCLYSICPKSFVSDISPDGNERNDAEHPLLTKRLQVALNFQSKQNFIQGA